LLQEDLNIVKSWSETWQLDVSVHKCTMLHIDCDVKSTANVCHSYTIEGVQLSDTSETTDLGIIIDSKLRFEKRITSVVGTPLIKRCLKARDHNLLL